jgi:pyruvate-ferredoxin/flavodoxin oxidoreductase
MVDSKEPSVTVDNFLDHENRFTVVKNSSPEKAEEVLDAANAAIQRRLERMEVLKGL